MVYKPNFSIVIFIMLIICLLFTALNVVYAQDLNDVKNTIGILDKINAGGVPLICLTIAVICGVGLYWQLKRNVKQHKDHLDEVKASGAARLSQQGELLREMLERDNESQEAHNASTRAIESITEVIKGLRVDIASHRQKCNEQINKFDNLINKIYSSNEDVKQLAGKINSLSTELRLLREDLRGPA
jgi:methyl-accepting chemotaxis protein